MKNKTLALMILIGFVLVFGGMLFYNFYYIKEIRVLRMQLEVADKIGVNVDDDAIYFGKVYPGNTARRIIEISNNYADPLIVSITIKGDISPFVSVSQNEFILEPGEDKVVTYYASTTKETPKLNYTGETRVFFKRKIF